MNNIDIKYKKKNVSFQSPGSFEEMSQPQFIEACRYIIYHNAELKLPDSFYETLAGIPSEDISKISTYQKFRIKELFEFVLSGDFEFSNQLIDYIEVDGIKYYGYQSSFGNTTWEEYIFADQFFISKNFEGIAAVLYRPERLNYDGETDIRIPFSSYGINTRIEKFKTLDPAVIMAIAVNYRAMRKKSIENRYYFIFPPPIESDHKPEKEPDDNKQFSWVKIHRDILGDSYFEEEKQLKTNVHVILNRLNELIKDSHKNGKK